MEMTASAGYYGMLSSAIACRVAWEKWNSNPFCSFSVKLPWGDSRFHFFATFWFLFCSLLLYSTAKMMKSELRVSRKVAEKWLPWTPLFFLLQSWTNKHDKWLILTCANYRHQPTCQQSSEMLKSIVLELNKEIGMSQLIQISHIRFFTHQKFGRSPKSRGNFMKVGAIEFFWRAAYDSVVRFM